MLKKSGEKTDSRMQSSEMRKTGENLPVATASRTDMKRYTRSQLLEVILIQSKENTALTA